MNIKKKKSPYVAYLFKALTMVLLLISVTFCWFIFAKDSSVGSIDVNVTEVITVQISNSEKNVWNDKLQINSTGKMVSVTEFSGDGNKLYSPITSQFQVIGFQLNKDTLNYNQEIEKDYIEIVSYIKTDGPISLYLGPDSQILPVKDSALKDNIVGAIRVAVLVEDCDPFIWAPNATYEFDPETGKVNKEGTPESAYYYAYKNTDDEFLTPEDIVKIDNTNLLPYGVSENKRFVWGDLTKIEDYIQNVDPIFRTAKQLTQSIEIKVVVRVWIEGTDREAVRQLIGGKFKMNLTFLAKDNK